MRPVTLGGVTGLVVPIGVQDDASLDEVLERARSAIRRGADLIEWRVDSIAGTEDGSGILSRLLEEIGESSIVTARGVDEGGGCELDDDVFASWLLELHALSTSPCWIDVEYVRWHRSVEIQEAVSEFRRGGVRALCTFHDFSGRPLDLMAKGEAMQGADVDAVKVVWRARSIRDCLECRDLLSTCELPMIALCMGQAGLLSRIMAGAWGAMATFAAVDTESVTAPGQPTIEELLDQWRFRSIDSQTVLTGLVGDPVGASPGFVLHNRAFDANDVNAVYVPLPVAAGWESLKASLATLIDGLGSKFLGVSITIPHKLDALRFVQEQGGTVSPVSAACGAANTVTLARDGSLLADNTDARGIVEPLEALGASLSGGRVAVLGAGGVARAAAAALMAKGASVHVFNRTEERATQLVLDLSESVGGADGGSIQLGESGSGPFEVVVQATSVGMATGEMADRQAIETVGLEAESILAPQPIVLETIYDPVETLFVQAAREAGCRVATGVDMWLAQAAAQQKIWQEVE